MGGMSLCNCPLWAGGCAPGQAWLMADAGMLGNRLECLGTGSASWTRRCDFTMQAAQGGHKQPRGSEQMSVQRGWSSPIVDPVDHADHGK